MPTAEPNEDFHPRRYHPTKDTRDHAFAVLPDQDLPQGVACAVHVENRDYLRVTKGTCDRFMLSETIKTLPTWLTEVSPGRFHSTQSAMFTSMMLKGLQMEESPELLRVVAPVHAAARRDAWVDPTDQFLHVFGSTGDLDPDEAPEDDDEVDHSRERTARRLTDYVYSVDEGHQEPFGRVTMVALVERAFFEENGCMDSVHVSEEVEGLPPCMDELAEGMFVTRTPIGELCMLLEAAGVRFHPGFDAFVKGPRPTPSM